VFANPFAGNDTSSRHHQDGGGMLPNQSQQSQPDDVQHAGIHFEDDGEDFNFVSDPLPQDDTSQVIRAAQQQNA
jgi:hypothetical protein